MANRGVDHIGSGNDSSGGGGMTDKIDVTPEAVAAMLESVTRGPWKTGGCSGRMILDPDESGDGFIADVDLKANANFIAWARDAVPALSARLAEVDSELDKLKESEEFLERCAVVSEKRWESANAKLTKATDALREIAKDEIYPPGYGRDPEQSRCAKTARATLAEIGEGHE